MSTTTADEHVSFTHDLRMQGNGAGKESNLKISTNSNLLIGESATGQFQVDGGTSNTEIDGTVKVSNSLFHHKPISKRSFTNADNIYIIKHSESGTTFMIDLLNHGNHHYIYPTVRKAMDPKTSL